MPIFKKSINLQQNQLLNAVLHNRLSKPPNAVEGQIFYDTGKKAAYLWNGSVWLSWEETDKVIQYKQYHLNIANPTVGMGYTFIRLFENQTVVRVDGFVNAAQGELRFYIEHRQYPDLVGDSLTKDPMVATIYGAETTLFYNPLLYKDYWLYFYIVDAVGKGALSVTITTVIV